MSWSVSASGKRADVESAIGKQLAGHTTLPTAEKFRAQRVLESVSEVLAERAGDDDVVSVSAYGSEPTAGGGIFSGSYSVTITPPVRQPETLPKSA